MEKRETETRKLGEGKSGGVGDIWVWGMERKLKMESKWR